MRLVLRAAIDEWSERHGWTPPEDGVAKLGILLPLWLRYGRVMNLTGARTEDALIDQILDGLDTALCAQLAGVPAEARWLDVGSGGGFPALVVSAVTPHFVDLIESRAKRASFLDLAIHTAALRRSRVERRTWSCSTWNENSVDEKFDVASARAVLAPSAWLQQGAAAVRPGGVVLIHSRDGLLDALGDPAAKVVGALGVIAAYRVPLRDG